MKIDPATRVVLDRFGFDQARLAAAAAALAGGADPRRGNVVQGVVEPTRPRDIVALPTAGSQVRAAFYEQGLKAIKSGWVGAVILAGGMATRFGGAVKALVEVTKGKTFLDLKLADIDNVARDSGGQVPVWLISSFATDDRLREAIAGRAAELSPVTCAPQFVSLRLTPSGELFRDAAGALSPYAPGHGDMSFALLRAGAIAEFRNRGGRYLMMSNVDNLAATLDPAIIGAHMYYGRALSAELVRKSPGDRGGAPARVDGKAQLVESFRFPPEFDQDAIPLFNTNTFVVDARAIDRDFSLSYVHVEKEVDGRTAVQYERLVGELTAYLPTQFLEVDRDERFQPVKDVEELAARRAGLEKLLRDRKML